MLMSMPSNLQMKHLRQLRRSLASRRTGAAPSLSYPSCAKKVGRGQCRSFWQKIPPLCRESAPLRANPCHRLPLAAKTNANRAAVSSRGAAAVLCLAKIYRSFPAMVFSVLLMSFEPFFFRLLLVGFRFTPYPSEVGAAQKNRGRRISSRILHRVTSWRSYTRREDRLVGYRRERGWCGP